MSLQLKEWAAYIATLLLTFFIFWLILPNQPYEPKGIALPITQAMATKLMSNPNWNHRGVPVAWINNEFHVAKDTPAARKQSIINATELAKQAGGKAVILQPLQFYDTTAESPMLSVLIGHGIAVK